MAKKPKLEEYPIGLEIDEFSIKMVQLHRSARGTRLFRYASRPVPPGTSKETLDGFLANAVKELFVKKKFRQAKVFVAIPGGEACVRAITLPPIPAAEIPESVKWAAMKHVAIPPKEVVLAYSILGPVEEGPPGIRAVFLVTSQGVFDRYEKLLRVAGLQSACLTSACFAQWNLLQESESAAGSVALVHMGHIDTEITLLKNKELVFTRSIPEAVRVWAEEVSALLPPSEEKDGQRHDLASEIMIKVGFSKQPPALPYGMDSNQVAQTLEKRLDGLVRQLQLSLSHYRQIAHAGEVEKVILSGVGVQILGLTEALSEKLHIPVLAVDPLFLAKTIQIEGGAVKPGECNVATCSVALGLALDFGRSPNLISNVMKVAQRAAVGQKKILQKAIACLIVLVGVVFGVFFVWHRNLVTQLTEFTKRWEATEQERMNLSKMDREIGRIQSKKSLLEYLKTGAVPPVEILTRLSQMLSPEALTVQEIQIGSLSEGSKLVLQVDIVETKDNLPEDVLAQLVQELKQMPTIRSVQPTLRERVDKDSGKRVLQVVLDCLM